VGATGLVGGHLLERLLADEAYERVVVLARRAPPVSHPKLDARVVSFDDLRDAAGALDVSDAFCALGTTLRQAGSEEQFRKVDLGYVAEFARGVRARAERFVLVSATGADPASRLLYNRVKGEAEGAVLSLSFGATHILRPSFLEGNRSEMRVGERVGAFVAKVASLVPARALRRIRPIEASAVAAVMIHLAKHGSSGAHVHESDDIQRIYESPAVGGRR
jgi:uncharacterized protein YbjT (DUF2867 family)